MLSESVFYRLNDDKTVSPCSAAEAGIQLEDVDLRRVALDKVNGCKISTVFIGISAFVNGKDLFETMVFTARKGNYKKLNELVKRYDTWDQAIAGHAAIAKSIKHKSLSRLSFQPLPE